MYIFDSPYFRLNKLLLSAVGLWPFQTPTTKVINLSFAVLCVATGALFQVIYIFKHSNDFDELFDAVPPACAYFINIVKVTCLAANFKKFKELLRLTQENWNNLARNLEMQIMMRYAEFGRKFAHTYLYLVIMFAALLALTSLVAPVLDIVSPLNETRPKRLIYSIEIFMNIEKYYYMLFLSEVVTVIMGGTITLSTDCIYFLLLQHICGMQAVLCHRLDNLKTCNKLRLVDNNQSYETDSFDYRVQRCIELDNRIRKHAQLMVSMFAVTLFFDIALGAILHTCTCIIIVVRLEQLSEMIRYIGFLITQSFRFLSISWTGQEMIDHSSDIPIAAYNAMWYIMPVKVQKMLMLLIARSQNHFRIVIGGMYTINLENFSSVMKTSVSYCTVMISLRSTTDNI